MITKTISLGLVGATSFCASFINTSWTGSTFFFVVGVLCLLGIGKLIEDNYHHRKGE